MIGLDDILDDVSAEADHFSKREERWLKLRSGLATASQMPKLAKSGKGKDRPWGDMAITELYGIKYERRTQLTLESVECKAFSWGHENEPLAMEALRRKYNFIDIRSCSDDYEDIVFRMPFEGAGDSPDVDIYNKAGVVIGLSELKCNISQIKFEKLRDITVIDNKHEYYWQFIMHFIGTPTAKFLIWGNYDAYNDQIHTVLLKRKDVEDDIVWLTKRIKTGVSYIDLCLSDPEKYKLNKINEYLAEEKLKS